MRNLAAISACAVGGNSLESALPRTSLINLAATVVAVQENLNAPYEKPSHGGSAPRKAPSTVRGESILNSFYLLDTSTYSEGNISPTFSGAVTVVSPN
jgi:hypothetical protein